MLGIEEILCELGREDEMSEQGLPPGFRFHPTDEELITFYLASKVFNGTFSGVHIAEVDLNRCEPWELPDAAKMGEREWYFFSLRDRKYPTGLRTNRATGAGYWKATGKDKEVVSAATAALLGMKKTLVFYKGRAPRGEKTKWVMHEYRLEGDFSCRHTGKEEWVICRIFHKMAEKKNQLVQGQNYLFYNPSCSANSLPPLLEPPQALVESQSQSQSHIQDQSTFVQNQNPHLFHSQESDIKTLIHPVVSQTGLFQAETLKLKQLMSNQELKELSNAIANKCKKESDFRSHLQSLSDNIRWGEEEEGGCKYQNPFVFGGIPSATVGDHSVITAAAIDHVMSTEPAFRWW